MMNRFRKWLYKPKRSDPQLLARFYYADEELNQVAAELDSLDGRKDPQRCTLLVSQFRSCQQAVSPEEVIHNRSVVHHSSEGSAAWRWRIRHRQCPAEDKGVR